MTAGARVHGRIGGHLRGARIGIVEAETVATADGRAEKDEAIDEVTIEAANVRDARAAKETVTGAEGVMETVSPEVTEISGRRGQSEEISKDCREPQPWARWITGKHQVQAAGILLGVRRPAVPFKLLPETVTRSPKLKVDSRLQDAVSITRWWSAPLQARTTKDASSQAASSLMSCWKIWLAGLV